MPSLYAIPITLSAADRAVLASWTRRRTTAQALALRARIVLAAAEPGRTNGAIAARLGVCVVTVTKWRRRFAAQGLAGLVDEPRAGAPRTITDAQIEQVITTTLESTPPQATHWSTRLLARRLGMSQTAIARIWKAFALQPHRSETFKLSADPFFVDKVRDIVGLYLAPPDRALVLCVDEKTQVPAREPTVPVLPMQPGQLERRTHDYGTRLRPARHDRPLRRPRRGGRDRHRRDPPAPSLGRVSALSHDDRRRHTTRVRAACALHLILDNSAIHQTSLVQRWLVQHRRVHLHFTPTSSAWLNLVESWFALLQRRELARGVYRSTSALEQAIRR